MSGQRTSSTARSLSLSPSTSPSPPTTNVTESPPSSSSSLSPQPASSSSSSIPDPTSPHMPLVSIIAGSLIGCIVLIAVALTFCLLNKRRKRLRAERASASSFDSSSVQDVSISHNHLGSKNMTPGGHNANPTPQLQETSSSPRPPSSAPPTTPLHYRSSHDQPGHSHQKYHPQPTQTRAYHQYHQQQQFGASRESSASSAQSQVPVLSPNLGSNSNSDEGPHGHVNLDGGGRGLIFVDSEEPNGWGGPNADVPKIAVSGHEGKGDEELNAVDKRIRSAGKRREMGAEFERGGRNSVGAHGTGNDGQQRASRAPGSVSGSEYSYLGFDESGSGRIGNTGRGDLAVGLERPNHQIWTSSRPTSASGSVSAVSESNLGSGPLPPSQASPLVSSPHHHHSPHRSSVIPSPAATSIPPSSYHPHLHNQLQQQANKRTKVGNLAPLILQTHTSHPSKHQQQELTPTPTYSEPDIGKQPPTLYTGHTPMPPLMQHGAGVEDEETPPAYENVWADARR